MPASVTATAAGPTPDLAHLRALLAHAAHTHRGEVMLIHPGVFASNVEVDVRPGLYGRTLALHAPPGSSLWATDRCTVVSVPVAALRIWLRDREGA